MHYGAPQLGGFQDVLKKVRAFVHKTAPRELSPTRMLEKYQSDQAKKVKTKLISRQEKQTAELARIKSDTLAQIKADSFAPVPGTGLTGGAPVAAPETNTAPIYLAAGLGALLLLALALKGKAK